MAKRQVSVDNIISSKSYNEDFNRKSIREGVPFGFPITAYSGADPAVGNAICVTYPSQQSGAGKAFYAKRINIIPNKNIKIRIQIKNPLFATNTQLEIYDEWVVLEKNKTNSIELDFEMMFGNRIELIFRGNLDSADTGTLTVEGGCVGILKSYSRDNLAPYTILAVGDSITRGSGSDYSPTLTPYNPYIMQVYRDFKNRGFRSNIVNKAISGIASDGMSDGIEWDYYDIENASIGILNIGMNDASTVAGSFNTAKQTSYRAAIVKFINWFTNRYPSSPLIVLGTSPCQNNNRHDNLEIIRGILQNIVQNLNNPRVYYLNLATAFDRTVTSFFASTDTAGDMLHLSQAGHNVLATLINNFIRSNNIVPI